MPLIYVSKYSPFLNLGLDRNRTIQTIIALILTFILGHLSFDFIETRFKFSETKDKTRINLRTISKNIAFLILLPTSLFVAMTYANTNGYWGLNRNIQPPIAAWDLDPECRRMSHQDSPCLYSTNNSKGTILLIGDSQAAQFSQAVIDAARNQGYDTAVWTQGLCYVQFDREFLNQVTNECLAQNHQIFNWSVRNKPVSIVVAEQVRADASLKDLIGGLSKMKSSSNNVLLIENIPKFADSADFMIARPIFMKPYNPPKTFPLSKMETYNIAASKSLAAQAKKIGIKTINFSSIFCDNKYCRRYSGNRWLYHDTGHLSEEGAKLTIPEFESYFRTF